MTLGKLWKIVPTAFLFLALAGCEPAVDGTPIPDVVGMHGDKANDALQRPDAYIAKEISFLDVHAGEPHARAVIVKSNWKVCAQDPAAGAPSVKNMTVHLAVVKNEEDCPNRTPGAAPASSARPSPTPTAAPAAAASPSITAPAGEATPTPTLPASPAPAATATHAPTTHAPAPAPTTHAAAGCTTDSKGNCIVRGRYCPDHGGTGTDAGGRTLVCENNNGWRWE